MRLTTDLLLETNAGSSVPCILMLHPQSGDGQIIEMYELKTSVPCPLKKYVDNYANLCLRTIIPAGPFRLENNIIALCADEIEVDPAAAFMFMQDIPDNVLQSTGRSRYCEADLLGDMAREIIGWAVSGYEQVEKIRSWIHDHFEYAYGTTDSSTSARDVLRSRRGVCRDYAHAGIALCRSLDIPARMVVGYLYDLNPMDMHAWFQAYIGGAWFSFLVAPGKTSGDKDFIAYRHARADHD